MRNTKFRWTYAAGAAAACVGVIVATSMAANAGSTSAALRAGAGAAATAPPSTDPASTKAPSTDPASTNPPSTNPASTNRPAKNPPAKATKAAVLGDIVKTGFGDWVLFATPVKSAVLPKTHFGVMAGRRSNARLTGDVITNETKGSDKATGFHAVQGTMEVDGVQAPTFGYYAGPATRITGKAHGKTVTAGQAVWSEDASVIFFWFTPGTTVNSLAAYDKTGKKLPTGHSGVGLV
ncbi:MAG: hypothetical protein QOH97_5627 [Actinoplanes sp.]|nr:hypothetical protein [Actinoplanes sp.]